MHQVEQRTYYSQVHRPLRALQTLLQPSERRFFWKKHDAMIQLPCKKNTIHAYNFTDRNITQHGKKKYLYCYIKYFQNNE